MINLILINILYFILGNTIIYSTKSINDLFKIFNKI